MLNLFQHLNLVGQNRTIDSLKLVLKNAKHDTTRCKIYHKLGLHFYAENHDSAFFYWQKTELISQKKIADRDTHKITYLKILGNVNGNLGRIYKDQGNIPKALQYYSESLKLKQELGDKSGVSKALTNIGIAYKDLGDISKALLYYNKSLKIYEEIGDKNGIASSLINIGIIYAKQGDIPKALENWHKSLKIQEAIGDNSGVAKSLNNIAIIYDNQGDFSKALEYHHKSLKLREEIGDKMGIANSLNNIGTIYQDQGDPSVISSKKESMRAGMQKALDYYNKSLNIQEEIGDKYGITSTLINIGMIYKHQGNVPEALACYQKCLNISKEIGDKDGTTTSLYNLGGIYAKQGNLKEALNFANRGLQLAKELGYPERIRNSAKLLKAIYQVQNKYKEAFEMYELEIKMRDSLNNQETQKAAIKKQMQYTYEKQEAVAKAEHKSELEKQQAVANEKSRKQKIVIFSVGIGLLLVVIFAGYVFKTLRVTRKQKLLIEHKNKEIEMKQKEVLDSIRYAKRIQMSLIPSVKMVARMIQKTKNDC